MASTNTPSVTWVVGDTVGRDVAGGTAAIPAGFSVSTATAVPTATSGYKPGAHVMVNTDDLYFFDGTAWQGPYSEGT